MKPIFLVGFMGSGKSTLARALCKATGRDYIDLDTYIERRFHANVRDIFATRGEDGFRAIEQRMLHEVADFEDVIVACGGGSPCFFDNMEHMNSRGITVWLDPGIDSLYRRLLMGRHRRPLIAAMTDDELRAYITDATARRAPVYRRAHLRFDSSRLESTDQISASISEFNTMIDNYLLRQ